SPYACASSSWHAWPERAPWFRRKVQKSRGASPAASSTSARQRPAWRGALCPSPSRRKQRSGPRPATARQRLTQYSCSYGYPPRELNSREFGWLYYAGSASVENSSYRSPHHSDRRCDRGATRHSPNRTLARTTPEGATP